MMVSIKDVPMLSADEQEIVLNGILYTGGWNSNGYGDDDEKGVAEIEAHRVISLNVPSRHFRTRCTGGCESEHTYAKGCSRDRLYASIDGAKAEVVEKIKKELKKKKDRYAEIGKGVEYLEKELARVMKMKASDVKSPRALAIT